MRRGRKRTKGNEAAKKIFPTFAEKIMNKIADEITHQKKDSLRTEEIIRQKKDSPRAKEITHQKKDGSRADEIIF